DELRECHDQLQRRIEGALARELGYPDESLAGFRKKVADRTERLLLTITEMKLKAFGFRLMDATIPDSAWLESLGTFVAFRPPDRWKDEDEETFERELSNLAGRFKRAESAAFAQNGSGEGTGLRVAITLSDGSERQEVVHFSSPDVERIHELRLKISNLIA